MIRREMWRLIAFLDRKPMCVTHTPLNSAVQLPMWCLFSLRCMDGRTSSWIGIRYTPDDDNCFRENAAWCVLSCSSSLLHLEQQVLFAIGTLSKIHSPYLLSSHGNRMNSLSLQDLLMMGLVWWRGGGGLTANPPWWQNQRSICIPICVNPNMPPSTTVVLRAAVALLAAAVSGTKIRPPKNGPQKPSSIWKTFRKYYPTLKWNLVV